MYRTFLAWRYLAARRTNVIGIVGIMVGVGALILILSIMTGFLLETKRSLRGTLSDLILEPIHVPDREGRTIPYDPEPALAVVRADPRVAAACAQLTWYGILGQSGRDAALANMRMADAQSGKLSGVKLVGIDVADEFAATNFRAALESTPRFAGSRVADLDDPFAPPPGYAPEGRMLPTCIVGEQLASAWNLRRGSEIEIVTGVPDPLTGDFPVNNRRYVVVGTFRSGENEMDLEKIYFERAELADFLSSERRFSQILVRLHDYARDGKAVRDELSAKLHAAGLVKFADGREVRTWEDFRRSLLGAIENERVLMAIMLSLVVVVAAFTIFAILSMMVTEKRRDIGILSALGATPGGVTSLFLWIAFLDALIGAVLGAVLGVLGALHIDRIERWLSSVLGVQIFNRNVYLFDHIPAVVNPLWVAVIVLGAFACTLLFAAIPAWRAGRLDPLEALRYE
ncbi:MAG: FtsX-like permease family protein [Planctomycetes bacterium]|nr:FtsX-like permease family protein [Planctomycetota bacterium]